MMNVAFASTLPMVTFVASEKLLPMMSIVLPSPLVVAVTPHEAGMPLSGDVLSRSGQRCEKEGRGGGGGGVEVGAEVGAEVDEKVGADVGTDVGAVDGTSVGEEYGAEVGEVVEVGAKVADSVRDRYFQHDLSEGSCPPGVPTWDSIR